MSREGPAGRRMIEWRGQAVNNSGKRKKKLWIMAVVLMMICGQTVQAAEQGQAAAAQPQATAESEQAQAASDPGQSQAGAAQGQPATDSAQPVADQTQSQPAPDQAQQGSDQTQGQPATDSAQPGTDQRQSQPGTDQTQPGTDQPQSQPGSDQTQPGTDKPQPGTDQTQPGIDKPQPGTDKPQPGTDQAQPGTDKPQPGTDKPQPGTDKPQPGTDQSEPETDQSESETDKGQQGSEKPGDKDKGDKKEEGPFLEIDNGRIYKGMDKTFKEGYTPIQNGQKILLVVPFLEKTPIKDNQLQAGVNLGDTSTAPFVFKNYNTSIKKEKYDFVGNVQLDKDKKPVTGKSVEGEASTAETYLLELTLDLKEDLQAGSYPVEITITGQTESGRKISQKRTFYVTVKPIVKEKETEPESGDGLGDEPQDIGGGYSGGGGDTGSGGGTQGPQSQPKVMLEDYSISQVPMLAGEEASVKAKFVNTNKSAYIQNIKVTVGVQNNTLKFNRKNFYIDKVDAKGTFEVTFVAEVLKDTVENTDMLTFTIEYEDKEAKAITETEDILLQLGQPIELEAENLDIPSKVYAAETIPVSMKILNLSRTRIYNVRYTIEAEGLLPLESAFVGNMEAGSAAEGTAKIFIGTKDMKDASSTSGSGGAKSGEAQTGDTAGGEKETSAASLDGSGGNEKYGPTNGMVTLSYEDEFGEVYTKEIPFNTTINKPEILTPVIPKEEPETAGQWWISILTGIGGIALVLGILGVRRLFLRKADAYGGKNF